jgi:hypothetical protein
VRFRRILISVLALAIAPAWATSTTIYCSGSCGGNDQSAFNNATSSVFFQPLTFNPANLNSSTGYTELGVTVEDFFQSDNKLSISGGGLTDNNNWGFIASLPSVVNDFWFSVTGLSGSSLTVSFTDANGNHSQAIMLGASGAFFGITSAAPITNLQLFNSTGSTRTFTLTNFDFATGGGSGSGPGPSDAPEGATLFLIGGGLIGLRFLKKRNKPLTTETSPGTAYVSPQVISSTGFSL